MPQTGKIDGPLRNLRPSKAGLSKSLPGRILLSSLGRSVSLIDQQRRLFALQVNKSSQKFAAGAGGVAPSSKANQRLKNGENWYVLQLVRRIQIQLEIKGPFLPIFSTTNSGRRPILPEAGCCTVLLLLPLGYCVGAVAVL